MKNILSILALIAIVFAACVSFIQLGILITVLILFVLLVVCFTIDEVTE